jgi:hypothetical protein
MTPVTSRNVHGGKVTPVTFPERTSEGISRLLASAPCGRGASCPGSDPVPARASTPSAPSAGRRGPTGTAGSSPVQRVSSYAKTVSIYAPRYWKRRREA